MSLINRSQTLAAALAIAALPSFHAHANQVDPVNVTSMSAKPSVDFGYQSTGEAALRPAQVFDNGTHTYFRFRSAGVRPEIILVSPQGLQPLRVLQSGPYLAVNAVAPHFQIRFGELVAEVRYSAAQRTKAVTMGDSAALLAPQPVEHTSTATRVSKSPAPTFGPAEPVLDGGEDQVSFRELAIPIPFSAGSATLGPMAQRAVERSLAVPGRINSVVIVGRENLDAPDGIAQLRAFAIRDRLITAGIPVERITVRTGISDETSEKVAHSMLTVIWSQQKAPTATGSSSVNSTVATAAPVLPRKFQALVSDGGVDKTLGKWAAASGWDVVWHVTPVPQLKVNATYSGDFFEAASQLLQDVQSSGHSISAEAFANKVLEVRTAITGK